MIAYIVKRLLATGPVLVLVAVFVFLLLHLAPGDPAAVIAGDYATPEQIARIRAHLGLDRPLPEQFFGWVLRLLQGDLGQSIFSDLPVTRLIGQRIEPTLMLTLVTVIIAVSIAIPLGVLAAARAGSLLDRAVMGLAVI
jgi:peptide/nickel transport system permease protein